MTKKWKIATGIIFMVVTLVLSFASISLANQNPYKQHKSEQKWKSDQHASKIFNLTPKQKEKINYLRLNFREEIIDYRSMLEKKRIKLQRLFMQEIPNRSKIHTLVEEMSNIKTQINKKTIDFVLELRKILTKKQFNKFSRLGIWRYWQQKRLYPLP